MAMRAVEETLGLRCEMGMTKSLVILESTTYPGTTEEVVKPILEKGGLGAGEDFFLAFSPERIDPGNTHWTIANTPKLVGGLTESCGDSAATFYRSLGMAVVRTKGPKESEMAKLLENTYRHVNIALVNELWRLSYELGIDVWDVIAAAETKPYGFQAFRPGPGVGGHCIPIDPNYLSHRVKSKLGQTFRMVELAQDINSAMPDYVVGRTQELLNDLGKSLRGSTVLVLGVTYKPGISDMRESPAIPVLMGLVKRGAKVDFHDPYVEEVVLGDLTLHRVLDPEVSAKEADCVILVQAHREFQELVDSIESSRILDTRGMKQRTA
jgi:nucleotide sugar dehydrogenase